LEANCLCQGRVVLSIDQEVCAGETRNGVDPSVHHAAFPSKIENVTGVLYFMLSERRKEVVADIVFEADRVHLDDI
jgi:hypothetical protein